MSLLKSKAPYAVVRVSFVRLDKAPSIGDQQRTSLDGYWWLRVLPVPTPCKAMVRKMLIGHGLPKVAAWMHASRSPSWYFGRKHFHVVADVWNGDVTFEDIVERVWANPAVPLDTFVLVITR
jgi:hypothetical protein